MKKAFYQRFVCTILGLCSLGMGYSQNQKYIIQTDREVGLVAENVTTAEKNPVSNYKKTGGGFLYETANPGNVYLYPENGEVKLKILCVEKNTSTEWISAPAATNHLTIKTMFDNFEEKTGWFRGGSLLDRIAAFFSQCRDGRTGQGSNAALKTNHDDNFSFYLPDTVELARIRDFDFSWDGDGEVLHFQLANGPKNKVVWEGSPALKTKSIKIPAQNIEKLARGKYHRLTAEVRHKKTGKVIRYNAMVYLYSKKEQKELEKFLGE